MGVSLSSRNRIFLNIIVGILLATSMIVSLTLLPGLSNSQEVLLENTPPVEETKVAGGSLEGSQDLRAPSESEIAIAEQTDEANLAVYTDIDPIGFGTPLAIAVITSIAAFTIVRNRLD
jgi:hypothetical protein